MTLCWGSRRILYAFTQLDAAKVMPGRELFRFRPPAAADESDATFSFEMRQKLGRTPHGPMICTMRRFSEKLLPLPANIMMITIIAAGFHL